MEREIAKLADVMCFVLSPSQMTLKNLGDSEFAKKDNINKSF